MSPRFPHRSRYRHRRHVGRHQSQRSLLRAQAMRPPFMRLAASPHYIRHNERAQQYKCGQNMKQGGRGYRTASFTSLARSPNTAHRPHCEARADAPVDCGDNGTESQFTSTSGQVKSKSTALSKRLLAISPDNIAVAASATGRMTWCGHLEPSVPVSHFAPLPDSLIYPAALHQPDYGGGQLTGLQSEGDKTHCPDS